MHNLFPIWALFFARTTASSVALIAVAYLESGERPPQPLPSAGCPRTLEISLPSSLIWGAFYFQFHFHGPAKAWWAQAVEIELALIPVIFVPLVTRSREL